MINLLDQVSANLNPRKVSVIEFAESDEFCSKKLFPRQKVLLKLMFLEELTGKEEDILNYWIQGGRRNTEIQISPRIRERIQYLRDQEFAHFREVVLVGGRRSSKGFITGIAMAKILYDALQLQDPGTFYDIDPKKEILFSCIATSEQQAREMQFGDLQNTLEGCAALQKNIVKSLENEVRIATAADLKQVERAKANKQKAILRDIARLRAKALSSNASSIRGSATLTACLDEVAHMIPGESRLAADQVYDALNPSLDQFGRAAMLFLNSSPYTRVGKFYEKFAEAMEVTSTNEPKNPLIFTMRFPSWALFEGYQDDPERRFRRAITVSPDWDENRKIKNQYYYSSEDRRNIPIARQEELSNPEKYKVERRGQFAEVIDAYLNPVQVDRMFLGRPIRNSETGNLEHILLQTNWNDSTNRFRYKAHVDPSSTTAGFGFALGHIEELPTQDGNTAPHVIFDILYRWDPKKFDGGVIEWREVMNQMLIWLDIFRPYEITFDQFQSHEPIQSMRSELHSRHISEVHVYEKTAPQPLNAKILTPTGWKTMGDMHPLTSYVIGADGQEHLVTDVYPKGIKDVYRVTFTDGSSTECTLDHLWRVKSHGERGSKQTLTLQEIINRGLRYPNKGSYKWSVQHVAPVEFAPQKRLPVDPYLLGSLLGDGCFHKSVSLCCCVRDTDEQENLITSLLPEGMTISKSNHGGWDTLYFKRPKNLKGNQENPLSMLIRQLGLWKVSGKDKFIPEQYLRASIEDRLALLQGLMDTDGHVGGRNYNVNFCNTSPKLIQGVADLVGSLGGSTTIHKNKNRSTINIHIKRLPEPFVPFRLQRKIDRYKSKQRSGNYRFIKTVELVGPQETQCIRVDSYDHLYVTDDYIVTHNTAEHNWNRAEVFKTALYQGLVHAPIDIPEAEYAGMELKFLQQKNTAGRYPRVDRQDIGPIQTKDIADCMMEVVNSLIGNMVTTQLRESLTNNLMAVGASGGYRIGGGQNSSDPRLRPYYNAGRTGEQRRTGASPRVGIGAPGRGIRREWGAAPKQRKLPGW